jgi:hypothetical protein
MAAMRKYSVDFDLFAITYVPCSYGPGFDSWQDQDFSLLHNAQSGSEASVSQEVKRPGRETDHSLQSSAEVKNSGAIPPLSHTSSWRGA